MEILINLFYTKRMTRELVEAGGWEVVVKCEVVQGSDEGKIVQCG
jgi:hypothetical protein